MDGNTAVDGLMADERFSGPGAEGRAACKCIKNPIEGKPSDQNKSDRKSAHRRRIEVSASGLEMSLLARPIAILEPPLSALLSEGFALPDVLVCQ